MGGVTDKLEHVGDGMKILGFNRVELLMSTEDLSGAVEKFVGRHGCLDSTCEGKLGRNDWTDEKADSYGVAISRSMQARALASFKFARYK